MGWRPWCDVHRWKSHCRWNLVLYTNFYDTHAPSPSIYRLNTQSSIQFCRLHISVLGWWPVMWYSYDYYICHLTPQTCSVGHSLNKLHTCSLPTPSRWSYFRYCFFAPWPNHNKSPPTLRRSCKSLYLKIISNMTSSIKSNLDPKDCWPHWYN